jgi:hypothetical protein
MKLEGFSENDFAEQKKNRWKVQGKSFLDTLKDVYGDQNTAQVNEHMYRCSFGIMSESVHCSWNDSMDWCLQRNEDDTFSIYPFFHPADIRYITPVLAFCNEPYALWLKLARGWSRRLVRPVPCLHLQPRACVDSKL